MESSEFELSKSLTIEAFMQVEKLRSQISALIMTHLMSDEVDEVNATTLFLYSYMPLLDNIKTFLKLSYSDCTDELKVKYLAQIKGILEDSTNRLLADIAQS